MSDIERIAELEATLCDLVLGACMLEASFDGAAQSYVREVKRVASAVLEPATVTRIERMVNPTPEQTAKLILLAQARSDLAVLGL